MDKICNWCGSYAPNGGQSPETGNMVLWFCSSRCASEYVARQRGQQQANAASAARAEVARAEAAEAEARADAVRQETELKAKQAFQESWKKTTGREIGLEQIVKNPRTGNWDAWENVEAEERAAKAEAKAKAAIEEAARHTPAAEYAALQKIAEKAVPYGFWGGINNKLIKQSAELLMEGWKKRKETISIDELMAPMKEQLEQPEGLAKTRAGLLDKLGNEKARGIIGGLTRPLAHTKTSNVEFLAEFRSKLVEAIGKGDITLVTL
ncbi:MAG: hypothetical protein LBG57_05835 [Treponema sp.]|nr:hypothetical protein [Treponema sp.]